MHIWETCEQDDGLYKCDHVWGRYLGTEKKELSTMVFLGAANCISFKLHVSKLLHVPVQFNYRTTGRLFQHLGFPVQVLFKYLRKLLCWRWVWAAILVGCWAEAVLPHCSSSSLQFFLSGALWPLTPSHLNRVMMKNYWYLPKLPNCSWCLSERFLYFMELSHIFSVCLCGFSWSCQQLGSPQALWAAVALHVIAAVHRGIWWSHLPFPGKALRDCFSPCLLGRLSLMGHIRL